MKKIINDGLPEAIYQSILNFAKQYDGNIDNAISVTTLIDSPLKHWYSKHVDVEVKSSEELWKLLGSAMHQVLENSDSSNVKELRLSREYDGMTIHGKCDVYDVVNKTIEDYKFTGYSKYAAYPKLEHKRQLAILSWIFKDNGLPVNNLKVHYIWRNLTPYQLGTEGYPKTLVATKEFPTSNLIEDFIDRQVERHRGVINNTDGESDLECTLEERWGSEKYKVFKESNPKKALRVFDSEQDAVDYMDKSFESDNKGEAYYIKKVTTDFNRCENYCEYKDVCWLYYKLKGEQDG